MVTPLRNEPAGINSLFPRAPSGLLRDEFDHILSRLSEWEGQWASQLLGPSIDLCEAENHVVVTMDLPGMKAENIEIQVVGSRLTVSGERTEDKEDQSEEKSYHRIERRFGHFSRTITLPCDVDDQGVEATYQHGVLKIKMPKIETAKSRKIVVRPVSEKR